MSPYFSHHVVTTALFTVTIAVWVILELRQSRQRGTGAAGRDRGSYYVLSGCVAAGWVVTALSVKIPGTAIAAQPTPFILGLAITWIGIALRGWAFHTLGRYFTFRVQTSTDQPVITSGPYRLVRHPGYIGVLLILVGISLLYGTWIGVLAMAILPTAGLVNRIRVEERALDPDLGPAYRVYAAAHKRLIPHVW